MFEIKTKPERAESSSNKRGQADSPPRCSFVADATSLTPLRPAAYRERYVSLVDKSIIQFY